AGPGTLILGPAARLERCGQPEDKAAMFLQRLRFRGVKALNRDVPEDGGPLPAPSRRRLLILGAPGSGKTTILDCIRLLGGALGAGLARPPRRAPPSRSSSLRPPDPRLALEEAELAALELGDFPSAGQSLWIGMGRAHAWEELKRQHPEAAFAGLIRHGD